MFVARQGCDTKKPALHQHTAMFQLTLLQQRQWGLAVLGTPVSPDLYRHIKVASILQVLHGDMLVAPLLLPSLGLLCRPQVAAAPIPGPHPP